MRLRHNRRIAGVCSGFAEYLDLDVTLVRLLWAIVTVLSGFLPGVVTYVAAWIIMPEEPEILAAPAVGQHITNS
jgi:phage shock protein C